jgi:tetratricopeptide (TPR) repeat protein
MLLSFLRHISIRIWITLLLGGLGSLLVLPMLQTRFGLESNIYSAAIILLFFFLATGWVLNRWALNTADYLMAEAAVFERDGMYQEAENSFQKAVAIFDSFMVSPIVKRKKAGELGARLARFYLARSRRDHASEDFLISYLKSNPQDGEVAEHWLQQVENAGGLKEEHQELAASIGEAQPHNRFIQGTLARFYLLLERTDFAALQTYRRVYHEDKSTVAGFIDNLARLFIKEGRADEWALEIYLQALATNGGRSECLNGLAACVRWTPATERNQHLLKSAHHYLKQIDADTLKKMRARFNPPVPTKSPRKIQRQIKPGALLAVTCRAAYRYPGVMVQWVFLRIKSTATFIQRSKKVRRVLSGILIFGLVMAIGALVINTVRHLSVKEVSTDKQTTPEVKTISDPFTLQVAAYLKPEYAKKYVQQLKKQGVDAYWSEAVKGDKRWYQVRVSHFATKQSARDFGEKLKADGIIDDYYVANYRRQ